MIAIAFVAAVVVEHEYSTLPGVVVPAVMSMAFIIGVVFGRLSAVVAEDRGAASLLFGWPRRVVDVADLVAERPVRPLQWHGLGIRRILDGRTRSVGGFRAVERELASSDMFSVGSAEPDALYDAISSRIAT